MSGHRDRGRRPVPSRRPARPPARPTGASGTASPTASRTAAKAASATASGAASAGAPDPRLGPALVLRAGKEKSLLRRHPWVYATAVDAVAGHPGCGDTVRVLAADGRFLAWAAYSPASAIRARAWGFDESRPIDAAAIRQRVRSAVARRAALAPVTDAVRLVFGEADLLPGLVADRYGAQLVVQFLAAGVERWRDEIVAALREATGCTAVHERSDAAARQREGLPLRDGPIAGPAPAPAGITEHGVRYQVDVVAGHKTGFYIDQRDNRALVAALSGGRSVLNCFCYTGGFSLAARRAGAAQTVSIDSSAEALQQAVNNERLNGLDPPGPILDLAQVAPNGAIGAGSGGAPGSVWLQANVFDALKLLLEQGRAFDVIVLDPPKFAPSAQHVERAARAYKEINLKALRLLAPGGHLLTFSCSGAISVDLFQKIVAGAVFDAGVEAQMLRRLQAGTDHPMLMTHPEGEYLKGLLLQRVA